MHVQWKKLEDALIMWYLEPWLLTLQEISSFSSTFFFHYSVLCHVNIVLRS